jgi:hypothetical protein
MAMKPSAAKAAEIYSIPIKTEPGFAWKWRSRDGTTVCAECFLYYHDCLVNARRKGYHVELKSPYGANRPGGEIQPASSKLA